MKNAFIAGGSDPRAWDQSTLDDTPVAHFGDVLYVQVCLSFEFYVYYFPVIELKNFVCALVQELVKKITAVFRKQLFQSLNFDLLYFLILRLLQILYNIVA